MTSFEFRLHTVGPLVLAGAAFFLWDRAKEITDFYLDYVKDLPDELTTALLHWNAPPAPFLPESIHGQRVAIIAACYAGAAEAGEGVVAPIRALKPAVDLLAPLPYTALQSFFDPLFPKGIYSYSKSDYFDKIPARNGRRHDRVGGEKAHALILYAPQSLRWCDGSRGQ